MVKEVWKDESKRGRRRRERRKIKIKMNNKKRKKEGRTINKREKMM